MRTETGNSRGGLVIVISLLAVSLAVPASTAAQSNSGAKEEHVKVVAHLALPGVHVNSMFVQHSNGKYFLYLHRPARKAFALIDVTRPNKPVIVERATMSEPAHVSVDAAPNNPALVIAVAPDVPPALTRVTADPGAGSQAVVLPTETVRFVDLSEPNHPKTIKSFSGVTSFLPDDSRRLVYIVNREGLWIVSHRQSQPMPLCTSEDALTQDPNCQ